MTRGGAHKKIDDPERKCIATGEVQPKLGLIRFVASPDSTVFPDVMEKLPGRGVWVSAERSALEKAVKNGLFARSFKQPVQVPENLIDEVEKQIARRLVDLLSLARKSGHAVSGYEKVKDWLQKEAAQVLIQASDGSERGKSKLSTPYGGSFIGWLTANELGAAFGRETTIHCALASGGLTQRVVDEAQRLKGLRITDGGKVNRRKGKDS
jgi:predicted RNA-binding protein YlxR (DUF448 family)